MSRRVCIMGMSLMLVCVCVCGWVIECIMQTGVISYEYRDICKRIQNNVIFPVRVWTSTRTYLSTNCTTLKIKILLYRQNDSPFFISIIGCGKEWLTWFSLKYFHAQKNLFHIQTRNWTIQNYKIKPSKLNFAIWNTSNPHFWTVR